MISISSSVDLISFVELLSIHHAGEKVSHDKFLKKDGLRWLIILFIYYLHFI